MQRSFFLKHIVPASLALLALGSGNAWAQASYPNKPMRLVVTFPSGGAPDILARLFSEKAQMGQPVVVDNKPGAGGNIGADIVAKAPGDGYTFVMVTVARMPSMALCTKRCPTTW